LAVALVVANGLVSLASALAVMVVLVVELAVFLAVARELLDRVLLVVVQALQVLVVVVVVLVLLVPVATTQAVIEVERVATEPSWATGLPQQQLEYQTHSLVVVVELAKVAKPLMVLVELVAVEELEGICRQLLV